MIPSTTLGLWRNSRARRSKCSPLELVLRHLGQRDVLAHVVQVCSIVLAHDEELAAVAEHGRADAALLESRVLLDNRNVPAIELAKLGVGFLNDFLATRMSRKRATSP
jgi:hypothetical protein